MLKNKKILFLVRTMELGGAERFTIDLANSVKNDFSSVTIASTGGEYEGLLKKKGIKHIKLKEDLNISNLLHVSREIYTLINRNSYNIVHTQHRILQFALQLIPRKNFYNVYTSHNYFNDIYQKMIFPDKAVAVSPSIEKNLKKTALMNKNRISHINCCTEIMPDKKIENTHPVVFGFTGRFIKEKGIFVLLDAAALLKNEGIEFKMIFRGAGQASELLSEINKRSLNEEVSILPFTSDKNEIYNSFNVLILPSNSNEGLPLTILEAATRKILVITGSAGGTADFIKHKETGILLKSISVESVQSVMKNVISEKYNIPEITKKAYDLVKKEYSVENTREKYLKIYEELFI